MVAKTIDQFVWEVENKLSNVWDVSPSHVYLYK